MHRLTLAFALLAAPAFAAQQSADTPPAPADAPARAAGAADMRARLSAMDTDGDSRMSKAEWTAAGRRERGFKMMDTDKDGYLTRDEIRAGMERFRARRG